MGNGMGNLDWAIPAPHWAIDCRIDWATEASSCPIHCPIRMGNACLTIAQSDCPIIAQSEGANAQSLPNSIAQSAAWLLHLDWAMRLPNPCTPLPNRDCPILTAQPLPNAIAQWLPNHGLRKGNIGLGCLGWAVWRGLGWAWLFTCF